MRWLIAGWVMLHAVVALGGEPLAHEDPFANFKFPQVLGSYVYQNRVEYPRVGLGYGLNYAERSGSIATLSIYDLNLSGIADGTSDPQLMAEFDKLGESIAALARQGGFQAARRLENIPLLSKAWLQVNHELVGADGRRAYVYSFMRAQSGKFVRIRITTQAQGSYERLPRFLLEVSRAIGLLKPAAG